MPMDVRVVPQVSGDLVSKYVLQDPAQGAYQHAECRYSNDAQAEARWYVLEYSESSLRVIVGLCNRLQIRRRLSLGMKPPAMQRRLAGRRCRRSLRRWVVVRYVAELLAARYVTIERYEFQAFRISFSLIAAAP
jgi:hypothetical protein